MVVLAMRLHAIPVVDRIVATSDVFGMAHTLKMKRIYARPVFAKMIDFGIRRDITDENDV